jgi:IS605 OrfB family transposase
LNKGKAEKLRLFLDVYAKLVRYFIEMLWSRQDFSNRLNYADVRKGMEKYQLMSHLVSHAYNQAKEIVCSQRKKSKRKRRMPKFRNITANLSDKFFKLSKFEGYFDWALKFYTKQKWGENIIIPFNNTKHTLKFINDGWVLSNFIRLGMDKKKRLFIDLIFEKPKPPLKQTGEVLGIDLGYRVPVATSRGELIGIELKTKIEKAGKRRKSFHHYVQTELNRILKTIDLSNVKTVVLEQLKNVKKNKREKFSRSANRLLSFWHYARATNRLRQICEEKGIRIEFKNPYKTSQRCPICGKIDRRNRSADKFRCINCGFEENADIVGALNLKALGLAGVYSLRFLPSQFNSGINAC